VCEFSGTDVVESEISRPLTVFLECPLNANTLRASEHTMRINIDDWMHLSVLPTTCPHVCRYLALVNWNPGLVKVWPEHGANDVNVCGECSGGKEEKVEQHIRH
jgi:hypothetical protein